MPSRLYLDVCCFNRPFDDWSQSRIRLEADDRLIRRAIARKEGLGVCVTNPVTWFMEVTNR